MQSLVVPHSSEMRENVALMQSEVKKTPDKDLMQSLVVSHRSEMRENVALLQSMVNQQPDLSLMQSVVDQQPDAFLM